MEPKPASGRVRNHQRQCGALGEVDSERAAIWAGASRTALSDASDLH